MSWTQSSLLRAAQADDPSAWTLLVNRYSRRIYRWCRRSGLQPDDAQDVVQEVLRAVARKLRDFEHAQGLGSFRGWLRRITQNKLSDKRRRSGRDVLVHRAEFDIEQWSAKIVDEVREPATQASFPSRARGPFTKAVQRVQAAVSPQSWQVFWQLVVDCRAVHDVAADFDLTTAAVRQAKSRVLRRLRAELSSESRP